MKAKGYSRLRVCSARCKQTRPTTFQTELCFFRYPWRPSANRAASVVRAVPMSDHNSPSIEGVISFGARHGRGRLGERRELVRGGIGHDQRPRIGRIKRAADPGHDRRPDVTPVCQRRVELRLQLSRAQVEHPVPATDVERPEDALLHSGGQPRTIIRRAGMNIDAAARGQSAKKRAAGVGGAIEGTLRHLAVDPRVRPTPRGGDLGAKGLKGSVAAYRCQFKRTQWGCPANC